MTTSQELIVVSGASSGMGRATAIALAARGFHVLAGVRTAAAAEHIQRENIEPVVLDITDERDIAALVDRVEAAGRPLRAVVNCAGMAVNGPIEALPLTAWRQMFEVNLLGHVAVVQSLLPALRRSNGRIVNISSTGGRIAMAAFGAYSATKFAVEAMSDSLRREVRGQGVDVVVIQPGGVKTGMGASGTRAAEALVTGMSAENRTRYDELMSTFFATVEGFDRTGMSAERAGNAIADVVAARRPKTRYTIGRDAALFTRLARILPDLALDRALASNGRRALDGARSRPRTG